jgi:hypothetical protein
MMTDGCMKKWVHNDDGWMDEEGKGGGESLTPTYEKNGEPVKP